MQDHTEPLFLKLKTLKLKDIYRVELAILMHKVYNKSSHFGKLNANKFTVPILDQIHSHNTRSKQLKNFYVARVQTK